MPELPEVETVRRVLEMQIQGLAVESLTVGRPEVVAHPTAEAFCSGVVGRSFVRIDRRGKFLLFMLDDGGHIVLHLRMTGCLLLAPADAPPEKHTHLTFRLSGGRELRFSDVRRFGRVWLLEKDEADSYSGVEKLGPEPFSDLTAGYLADRLGKRRKAVKECLLEQSVIAGIGNIYADEILFAAQNGPSRAACSLTGAEWARLAAVIPERLSYFIEKNAVTPEAYWNARGRDYRNTPFLQVYGKAGEPCPVCGEPLCRKVIGGRGSTYCPHCQREEKED